MRTLPRTFTLPLNRYQDVATPTLRSSRAEFEDYQLLKPIGIGGMGTVYMAVRRYPLPDKLSAPPIALKVMNLGSSKQHFENESKILASLRHGHIVRTLDHGQTLDGRPFLAMEYVDGTAIHEYCDTFRLNLRRRLELVVDLCQAVQHVHDRGVVHRDLKPANILVTHQGVVKLLDFGIAKLLTGPDVFSQAALTPAYASPEQVQGFNTAEASDIYSLGGLLYKLLTGSAPHLSLEYRLHQLDRRQEEDGPPPPSQAIDRLLESSDPAHGWNELRRLSARRSTGPRALVERLRGDLDCIAMKALSFQASERYASAAGMARDLRRYLDGRPTLARSKMRRSRIERLARGPGNLAEGLAKTLRLTLRNCNQKFMITAN